MTECGAFPGGCDTKKVHCIAEKPRTKRFFSPSISLLSLHVFEYPDVLIRLRSIFHSVK